MAFAESSRLTTNILVVIGCVVASFSGRDPTPVQTRTEIVSVMNIPARNSEPAVAYAVNMQGGLAMQVATVVAPAPGADLGALPAAASAPVKRTESSPVADQQPLAHAATPQVVAPDAGAAATVTTAEAAATVAAATATATASRQSAKPPAARRAVIVHRGGAGARPARQIAAKAPAGTHGLKRKAELHAAREDQREQREQAPVPAVFVPIRNFGFFLQAKFTNAQDGCVAKADARKQRGHSKKPQVACR